MCARRSWYNVTSLYLFQLHARYSRYPPPPSRDPRHSHPGAHLDAIEELRHAFDQAERASPGITDLLVHEIVHKLQPGLGEARVRQAVDRLRK